MRLFIVIFTLFFSTSAFSYEEPTCEELNDLYYNKYESDFEVTWSVSENQQEYMRKNSLVAYPSGPFPCPKGNESEEQLKAGRFSYYHIAKSFYYLDKVDIIDSKGREIFDYYKYVTDGVESTMLRYDGKGGLTAEGYGDGTGFIYLPLGFFKESSIYEAAGYVHERRHFDPDDPGHEECDSGDLKGERACDNFVSIEKFDRGSGYHYNVKYFIDAHNYGGINDLQKSIAKKFTKGALLRAFNNLPNSAYLELMSRFDD